MSGEEIILNIGDNSYNLVCKDREIRKEIIANRKKNWSKKQKKNARRAENRKNRVDKVWIPKISYPEQAPEPDYLTSDNSHQELDDEDLSKLIKAGQDYKLKDEDILWIEVMGRYHKIPHTKLNPIWEKSGLCYLAAIKTSALNEYPWKMDISLIDLATMSRSIRRNIQFDLKEVGEDHHYELVPNPMSLTGWWMIDNIVSHRPFWTIGGDDTKDLPELICSNWLLWSLRMRAYLQAKEMWQYVDGTIKQPKKYLQEERSILASIDEKGKEVKPKLTWVDTDQVDLKFMEWSKQDDKALGIMTLKISPSLTYLLKLTAAQTWNAIEARYGQPGAAGIYVDFLDAIHWEMPANKNPAEELGKLLTNFQRLASNKFYLPENMQAMLILAALPPGWDTVAMTLLHQNTNLHLNDVIPVLQEEWNRHCSNSSNHHSLNVARSNIRTRGNNRQWRLPYLPRNQQQQVDRQEGLSNQPLQQRIGGFAQPQQNKNRPKPRPQGGQQLPQGQKGPNYSKNCLNCDNNKKKRAMMAQEENRGKVNNPQFACTAIKQEEMEVDLKVHSWADEVKEAMNEDIHDDKENHYPPNLKKDLQGYYHKGDDEVSLGSWGGEDIDIDNWSWYVSKSLSLPQTDNKLVKGIDSNNSTYSTCNNIDRINVALKSEREIRETDKIHWLIDGGASLHIMPHMSDFSEYYSYSKPELITTAHKNVKAEILGKGVVYIQYEIGNEKRTMRLEMCFMPTCSECLLSSGQLKMCGYKESSDKNVTKFSFNGKLELQGHPRQIEGPAHWVNCHIIHKKQVESAYKVGYDTWHQRMAHPSKNVLSQMFKNVKGFDYTKTSSQNKICQGCMQGKMHDTTYKSSEKHAKWLLELIHADLVEFPIESYHKKRWVLTILDDYSSYAHVALLHSKSETMQYMQSYVTMMENQTNKKLKIFQSDQGGEFKSHEFNNYLQSKGIVRQQSAPHIHQQNGRAERLNQTLLEKVEAM